MASLHLPADQAAELNQRNAVRQVRYEIAREVYGNLMALSYAQALAQAKDEADPFGTKPDGDDERRPRELNFQIDLECPAKVAVAAADALLIALGVMRPPAPPARPAINEGPR